MFIIPPLNLLSISPWLDALVRIVCPIDIRKLPITFYSRVVKSSIIIKPIRVPRIVTSFGLVLNMSS